MTDTTDNARGPDWEGFGRDLLEHWPVRDVDGSELFDAALSNGLIREIPGGFDPDNHIDTECICPEPGDPWYEYAFPIKRRADLAPTPQDDPRVKALVEALNAMLEHSCVADAGPDMKDPEDHAAERQAHAALAAFDKGGKDE